MIKNGVLGSEHGIREDENRLKIVLIIAYYDVEDEENLRRMSKGLLRAYGDLLNFR